MNLGEIEADFRDQANDAIEPYLWSSDSVKKWANEAEFEASIRAQLIVDSVEIPIAAGAKSCALPALLFDIRYAELREASGRAYEIRGSSAGELDSLRPGWRTKVDQPKEYIHNDKDLTLGATADVAYTLFLEFYRTPETALVESDDVPEIAAGHHPQLVEWVLFRAYSKPDADTFNPGKAREAEGNFESYFGKRRNADMRRRQNANRPHRNKLCL